MPREPAQSVLNLAFAGKWQTETPVECREIAETWRNQNCWLSVSKSPARARFVSMGALAGHPATSRAFQKNHMVPSRAGSDQVPLGPPRFCPKSLKSEELISRTVADGHSKRDWPNCLKAISRFRFNARWMIDELGAHAARRLQSAKHSRRYGNLCRKKLGTRCC